MDKLKIFVVLVVVIALSGCMEDVIRVPDFTNKTYINASNITVVGATATGSLQNITDLNQGYYNVSEGNAQPFYVIVNFTNITNFSFLEAKARYFSTSGTPSSHTVDLEIYCTTDNEYEDLFFLDNADDWRYFTRHFPDSMHFIDNQGNVSVKFDHTANGNVNHVLWIDTVRLITSAQYEQNIVTLTQYFNTTGTGGASNLSQLSIDTNKSWLRYNIYNVTIDNQTMDNKVNKTGDTMTGMLNITRGLNNIVYSDGNEGIIMQRNSYNVFRFTTIATGSSVSNYFGAFRARGTEGALLPCLKDDLIFSFYGVGYSDTGWGVGSPNIRYRCAENYNGSYQPNYLTLMTTNGSGTNKYVKMDDNGSLTVDAYARYGTGNYSILIVDSNGKIIAVPMNGTGNHYGCWNQSGYPYPGNPGC